MQLVAKESVLDAWSERTAKRERRVRAESRVEFYSEIPNVPENQKTAAAKTTVMITFVTADTYPMRYPNNT